MKNTQQARSLSAGAEQRLRRLILIFSLGACGVRFLLNTVYDVMLANLGSYALPVRILAYFNQAFSFCAIFALMSAAIYAKLTGADHLFSFAILMQAIAHLFIITIGYCFFVYLLAYIDANASVRPAFELSNFTLAALNSGGIVELLTVAFFDFLLTLLFIVIALPFIISIKKKYVAERLDTSAAALAKSKWAASPMRKPCMAFLVSFAGVSIVSLIISTVTDVISEAPVSISDYIVIATPYVMTVIYAAAGLLIMQIVSDKLCGRPAGVK